MMVEGGATNGLDDSIPPICDTGEDINQQNRNSAELDDDNCDVLPAGENPEVYYFAVNGSASQPNTDSHAPPVTQNILPARVYVPSQQNSSSSSNG